MKSRFRYPALILMASLASFVVGAALYLPGMCGGPGFLNIQGEWAADVALPAYLIGLAGLPVALIWFVVALLQTALHAVAAPEQFDLNPDNP